jgi:hypothetical protein
MENYYGITSTITPHYHRGPISPSETFNSNNSPVIINHHPQQYYHQLPVILNNNGHRTAVRAGQKQLLNDEQQLSSPIIIVDPPRPPFIPKKPVFSDGTRHPATSTNFHSNYSHLPQCKQMNSLTMEKQKLHQQQQIYAPPIINTIVTSTATTTTYIGSANNNENQHGSISCLSHPENGEDNCNNLSNSSTSNSTKSSQCHDSSAFWIADGSRIFPVIEQQYSIQENNKDIYNQLSLNSVGINKTTSLIASTSSTTKNTNTSTTSASLVVQDLQNLYNSTPDSRNKTCLGMSLTKQHRPSLLGDIPQQKFKQIEIGSNYDVKKRPLPTISYECPNVIRIPGDRLYSTGQAHHCLPSNISFTMKPDNATRLVLKPGSQTCLRSESSPDGKSTLSRKAQKIAQKAASKLTIRSGTLSSDLSSSASALYSLFTSSSSTNSRQFNWTNNSDIGSDENNDSRSIYLSNESRINNNDIDFWVRDKYIKINYNINNENYFLSNCRTRYPLYQLTLQKVSNFWIVLGSLSRKEPRLRRNMQQN